jgi:hypothetical protein
MKAPLAGAFSWSFAVWGAHEDAMDRVAPARNAHEPCRVAVSDANPTVAAWRSKVGFACGSPPPYEFRFDCRNTVPREPAAETWLQRGALQDQGGAARRSEIKKEERVVAGGEARAGDIRGGGLPRPGPGQGARTDEGSRAEDIR